MTPNQKRAYNLHLQGLSQRQIAEELGKSRRTVRDLLQRAKQAQDRDPAVQQAMDTFGTDLEPSLVWLKNKEYSVQLKPKAAEEKNFLDQVVEAFKDIPAAPSIPEPEETLEDQMVVYPLFDVHHGMRAHAAISGEEMDLEISKKRILTGLAKVMAGSPNARRAVIINGGDFTHQTDDNNKTRRGGHVLDVAGRNLITVLEAVEIIAAGIEMALTKHQIVEYYSVPGNHDPQNWETILIGLSNRYRDHPRVKIDETWNEFSVIEHGQVAIFVHHGDKRTPKDLAMFCMAEFRDVFGRTNYNLLLTGHLHHQKLEEFPGMIWQQIPAVAARDHHSAGGYKSHSLITAMFFDTEGDSGGISRRLK